MFITTERDVTAAVLAGAARAPFSTSGILRGRLACAFLIQPNDIAKAMVSPFDSEDFKLTAELRGESSFA